MKKLLSLSPTGEYEYPPYQKFGPGARDCCIIHYVISGKGYFRTGGKMWEITGGRAFIIYQGETIEYYADREDPWHYLWVDFGGELAEKLLDATGFSVENRVSAPLDNEKMIEAFKSFKNDFSSESAELFGMASLISLIAEIAKHFPKDKYDARMGNADRAKVLISRYYRSAECRVEDIAEMLGMSRSQLYRAFVEKYGISPKEYIDSLRIKLAKTLLEYGGTSVAEVCYSTGFSDPLYFSAVFKKRMGCSPSAYRKKTENAAREEGLNPENN